MLNIKNINQYYGGSPILRDVSLEAKTGEVTVILGRNGVGKTTLLKSLMGLVPIKTGSIELTPIGETETKLDYRGHLDVRHRMAARMRGLFTEIAEDQAHSLVHRVKVKAEQRRLAQERLLK